MFKLFHTNRNFSAGFAPLKTKTFNGARARARFQTGFTLIELVVSIAIIALITAIVVFNQADLSDQIALSNVANDISLQIRQAQVYGISVKELTPASSNFNIAYGDDFSTSNGYTTSFYSFSDQGAQNGYFDTPGTCSLGTNECLGLNQIGRGDYIWKLCVIMPGPPVTETCAPPSINRVAITFLRPNPAARIVFFNDTGTNVTGTYAGYLGAKIYLKSPRGKTKTITVYTTGQISVQ